MCNHGNDLFYFAWPYVEHITVDLKRFDLYLKEGARAAEKFIGTEFALSLMF